MMDSILNSMMFLGSGLMALTWQQAFMICVGGLLIYLGVAKGYELLHRFRRGRDPRLSGRALLEDGDLQGSAGQAR